MASRSRPFELGIWISVLVTLVLLAIITIVSMHRFRAVNAAQRSVEHTRAISIQLERVLSIYNDAETGQRGYLLTREIEYLEPFIKAKSSHRAVVNQLEALITDDPRQMYRIGVLRDRGQRKMDELSETVRLSQSGRHDEAMSIVRTSLGRRLMVEIRDTVRSMKDAELVAAKWKTAQLNRTRDAWQLTTLSISAIAAAIVLATGVWTTRRFRDQYQKLQVFDELKAVNDELEQFTRAACHDLRSPLRGIANGAIIIREDEADHLSESSRQCLTMMETRVTRMERLLDDLYEYSRTSVEDPRVETIDTGPLVAATLETLDVPEGFHVTVSPSMPTVVASSAPLRQVFHNLIDNAIKHHDRDDGVIHITAKTLGDHTEFSVSDDGPGIPEEHRERIFQLFQTLQTKDHVDGSGMGLALLRKTVKRVGGKLWVEAKPPRGSRFCFTWPNQPIAANKP